MTPVRMGAQEASEAISTAVTGRSFMDAPWMTGRMRLRPVVLGGLEGCPLDDWKDDLSV